MTVSLTIVPANIQPTAADDDFAVAVDSSDQAVHVLTNDHDVDGDPLTIDAISSPPTNGFAAIVGSVITYTPQAGYSGLDSFGYTISDDKGGTASATVTVNVADYQVFVSPRTGLITSESGISASFEVSLIGPPPQRDVTLLLFSASPLVWVPF